MSSFAKWSRRSKSGKDNHMNRKLNAAITAGLSLSMVLSSTPLAAIAAETTQGASEGAAAAASTGEKQVTFFANGGTFTKTNSPVFDYHTNENGEIRLISDLSRTH